MNYMTGKRLHAILIEKNRSIRLSARSLNLPIDEMENLLNSSRIEIPRMIEINAALNLGILIDPSPQDIEIHLLKQKVEVLISLLNGLQGLFNSPSSKDPLLPTFEEIINKKINILIEFAKRE